MVNGLNFYRFIIVLFLSFVSLWVTPHAAAQTSAQVKDEFAEFDKELSKTEKSKTPNQAPAPVVEKKPTENLSQKIERLKEEIRKGPKNNKLISELGQAFYEDKAYDKATLLLWKHVDKIDRAGLLTLAKSHEMRKEPAEMIRALNILIGKDEKDYEAYELMGRAYLIQRKTKDAMESFKKAIELNMKFEPAYDGLIRMYSEREPPNYYELRMIYQDLIDHIGPRPQYLRKMCEINTKDAIYESAIANCKDAALKDPTVADATVYLGVSYKATGEDKLAMTTLKEAAKKFPKSELAQYEYGRLLEEQKNYVDAMAIFKTGTEADPKAGRSWLGLATTSFEIRKYEIALQAYKNACKFDKKTAVAFRRATTVLRNQKNGEWVGRFESSSENCNL